MFRIRNKIRKINFNVMSIGMIKEYKFMDWTFKI